MSAPNALQGYAVHHHNNRFIIACLNNAAGCFVISKKFTGIFPAMSENQFITIFLLLHNNRRNQTVKRSASSLTFSESVRKDAFLTFQGVISINIAASSPFSRTFYRVLSRNFLLKTAPKTAKNPRFLKGFRLLCFIVAQVWSC